MGKTNVVRGILLTPSIAVFVKRWNGSHVATIKQYSSPEIQMTAYGSDELDAIGQAIYAFRDELQRRRKEWKSITA